MENKNQIYKALANFQQEVPVILKESAGYKYTYADWPTTLGIINPLLKKHGMGFYQAVNGSRIDTTVFHIESGQVITSSTDIPQNVDLNGMNAFQVLGSGITYIKRYALGSLLGLVTDKDTDGAEVINEKGKKPTQNKAMDDFEKSLDDDLAKGRVQSTTGLK